MKSGKERNVLIVDDEESVREPISRLLEREGYRVHCANSGEAALEILKQVPIQLVISDQNMPGMSGIELLKLIRERHPQVLRIMLTAEADPRVIIRSINEGEVYRFIPKPWDNIMLRVVVYFAFETVQLEEENRRLRQTLRRQIDFVRGLKREYPYLSALAQQEEAELMLAQADGEGEA